MLFCPIIISIGFRRGWSYRELLIEKATFPLKIGLKFSVVVVEGIPLSSSIILINLKSYRIAEDKQHLLKCEKLAVDDPSTPSPDLMHRAMEADTKYTVNEK